MRLPFVQVAQEAFDRATELAAVLQCGEAEAVGYLTLLWRWALGQGASDAAPDGVVEGATASLRLEAGCRWTGARGALVEAFAAVGVVQVSGDLLRVKGMDRYESAWAKRENDRERQAKHRSKSVTRDVRVTSRGRSSESQRKTQTQTQTQTQKEEKKISAGELLPAPHVVQPVLVSEAPKATDPRHAPLVKALVEASPGYKFRPRDGKAVTDLLALGEPAEVLTRWRRALARTGYPTVRATWELVTHWAHFATDSPGPRLKVANGPIEPTTHHPVGDLTHEL